MARKDLKGKGKSKDKLLTFLIKLFSEAVPVLSSGAYI